MPAPLKMVFGACCFAFGWLGMIVLLGGPWLIKPLAVVPFSMCAFLAWMIYEESK